MALLATGLILYVPSLSEAVGRRSTVKAVHLGVAAAWMTGLALVALLGDRGALRRTLRDVDLFDAEDARWLSGRRSRPGRFNAGQKLHAIVQGALAVLFALSGLLLWIVQRDTTFRLPGTIALHDTLTFVLLGLLAGHLFLALVWPWTRPALRGIVLGGVDARWAREHHPRWPEETAPPRRRPGPAAAALALLVLAAGAYAVAFVVGGH